jgi:DNA-binding response OmpR family regulator
MMKENILIIDDEVDICFLLSGILKSRNYQPAFANNLDEGFKKLPAVNPSILFLDINLPDGNGLDSIRKVKAISPTVKIIMISAYDGTNERNRAKSEGADGFIGKPFNKDLIYQAVDQLTVKPTEGNPVS